MSEQKNKRLSKSEIITREKEEAEKLAFDLVGLAGIDGIGFSMAAELHVLMGINTVHDLYNACREGKIATLKGWGAAKQRKLKTSIELNVLWFRSHCKKIEREKEGGVIENMAKAIGINSELMKGIAKSHSESFKK